MRKQPVAIPDAKRPNYHVTLYDGTTKIGLVVTDSGGNARNKGVTRNPTPRTALKTRSGELKWDSFNEPWTPIAQESWIGGRGALDYDPDATRFADSFRANTQYGYFSNGPLEEYATGLRTSSEDFPESVKFLAIKPGQHYHFASKRNVVTMTGKYLYLVLKRKGTPENDLTITIRDDNSGVPGTVQKTMTISTTDITDIVSEYRRIEIPSTYSFTTGTYIWIDITCTDADDDNYWSVGVYDKTLSTAKCSADGTNWISADYELYYRITEADSTDVHCRFFQYRYGEYAIITKNGAASDVYFNGYRGMADSNSGNLSKLIDGTNPFTADELVGCVIKIVAGPGVTEYQNWRVVTANAAGEATVSPAWIETHTTATEYVVLGLNKFTKLTSGLTAPVYYDPLVVNDIVYIPQGDAVPIMRMHWNSTTGAHDFSADSTNKATIIGQCRDATNGLQVWKHNNSDASGFISSAVADVVDWGPTTYLSFGTAIPYKDERGRITGHEEYGDTTKVPWVMREGSVFQIAGGEPDEIPLRELATMMDTNNGRAHLVHNIYIYWSYGYGIERYYDKTIDDVGPNKDQGLPTNRKGYVSSMVGYPGRYFASIDAGESGYSSVLVSNLTGWHEIYRAPAIGQRIRHMGFQTIPGSTTDRLWVHVGDDIIWLNFPSGGLDPLVDSNSKYTWESTITGAKMYVNLYNVTKFFRSFELFAENLANDGQTVEMDYRVNDETEWRTCPTAFDGDVREIFPVEDYGVNGISLTYRLRILTNDCTKTVRGKALVLNNISRVPVKYSFGMPYRVLDYGVDLIGKPSEMTAKEMQDKLDEWATQLTPLIMNCTYEVFDNKVVFIDPMPLNPLENFGENYLGKLTIVEI